ncbi:Uncharacterised protein [Raoultella terrigena]|uniref:Uncharacterized protein n=1 Tax=Raoultella terrigena TaxID=577 RepID=A0A3P8JGL5_RAOTE|nr:Uncharacterised protein [Raoultella terrigena]
MKPVIILLVLACAGLLWMRHDNSNLRTSFERANRVAGERKTTITILKKSAHRCRRAVASAKSGRRLL